LKVHRVIDFLKQTFDAKKLRRYDMPDGSIMHAEVRIDDPSSCSATPAPSTSSSPSLSRASAAYNLR
jgi:PhnB protein